MAFNVMPLTYAGEGHTLVNLGNVQVELVHRFNYSIPAWVLDLNDANGSPLVAGLVLVPNVNILAPYPDLTVSLGALVAVELNTNDHQNPQYLGTQVQLLWYPPGEPVVLP